MRSKQCAKSGSGRFSPVDTSAGVAKPPSSPSTAMKSDSRRIDSSTASAVAIARRTNVAARGDEIPQRVRGEERGEQNRDRGAVQGVGSRGASRAAFNSLEHEGGTDGHENTR